MRMHRRALLVLGGVLTMGGARVLAQQPTDATPLELVFVVFPDSGGAGKALSGISADQRSQMESYTTVIKDKSGKVTAGTKHDKKGGSASTSRASNAIDGMVALLGEQGHQPESKPAEQGAKPADTSGYAPQRPTSNRAGITDADMSRMSQQLTPGGSAIIFVVPVAEKAALESDMSQTPGAKVMDAKILPAE